MRPVALAFLWLVGCGGSAGGPSHDGGIDAAGMIAQIRAACVTRSACFGDDPGTCAESFAPGLYDTGVLAARLDCLVKSGADCAAAKACCHDHPCYETPACDGDRLIACGQVTDCAAFGAACYVPPPFNSWISPQPGAICRGLGEICQDVRCEGNVLVRCFGGHEARFDCSKAGAICRTHGPTAMCAFAAACNDDEPATCLGPDLTFCEDGVRVAVDCRRFGFSGCGAAQGGITLASGCVR